MATPYDGDALVGDLVNTEQFDHSDKQMVRVETDGLVIPKTSKRVIVRRTTTEEIEFPDGTN